MSKRRSVMLSVVVLVFAGAWMTGACDGGGPVVPPGLIPDTQTPEACPDTLEDPCKRYRVELAPDPNTNLVLRAAYIAKFGSACYLSEANTFDCWYKTWEKACQDAVLIGEVSGNAPYDKGYKCQPVGNGDYTLQIGSDVSNVTRIHFDNAPRQTPLVMVNGMPVEVNGPYRNLVDPNQVAPGYEFDRPSDMFNDKGEALDQRMWVLAVNQKMNGGKIRSDLAGFMFPCTKGKPEMCPEPDFLEHPKSKDKSPFFVDTVAQVHHVVPRKDKRCCPWGTNGYKNAAIISAKLNRFFTNNDPPEEEVKTLNNAAANTP